MSIPQFMQYKDSGIKWIGKIPSEWEVWKVAHAFEELGSGTTPSTEESKWYEGGTVPWVNTSELRESIIYKTNKMVTTQAVSALPSLRLLPEGTLLIAMYGATIGRLGILGLVATTNQACCALIRPKALDVKFTFYWFQAFKFDIIQLYSYGGGQPNISREVIANLKIPCPRLIEQTQIARFLDHETAKIDALIAEQKRLIELLKEKRQAVISHAVTKGLDPSVPMKDSGVEWLGEVPEHWGIGCLKHLLRIRGGQDYKAVESDNPADYPVIGSGGQFTYAKSFLYEGESVLLGRKGTIDKPLYINGKFWTVDTMFFTEILPRANGKFAYFFATTIPFGLYSTNTALPSMSQFDLANHKLPIPPVFEQAQIAYYLDERIRKFDALTNEATKSITYMNERRTALISAAVTGKIDVRNWQPPADESAFSGHLRQAGLEVTA